MYTLQIQHTCEHSDSRSLHYILLTPCCLRLIDFHDKCADPLAEQVEAERTSRSVSANRLTKSVVQVALVRSSLVGTERHRVDDAESKSLRDRSQSQVAVAQSFMKELTSTTPSRERRTAATGPRKMPSKRPDLPMTIFSRFWWTTTNYNHVRVWFTGHVLVSLTLEKASQTFCSAAVSV